MILRFQTNFLVMLGVVRPKNVQKSRRRQLRHRQLDTNIKELILYLYRYNSLLTP